MTIPGRLLLVMMVISILSYGFSASSFAQQTPADCDPKTQVFQLGVCQDIDESGPQAFSIETDQPSYDERDTITISGNVGTISTSFPTQQALTIIITGPTGNIVGIAQVTPDASGQFSHNITAGGTMNASGDYKITAMELKK